MGADKKGITMTNHSKINRRSFVQGQMAVAAAVGLGTVAHAESRTSVNSRVSRDWATAKTRHFSKLTGQTFTARDRNGNIIHLKLAAVESGRSGAYRPLNLSRRESTTLLFDCDCAEDFAAQGHQTVWIHHPELGQSQLFLGAVPRRNGSYEIEAILN